MASRTPSALLLLALFGAALLLQVALADDAVVEAGQSHPPAASTRDNFDWNAPPSWIDEDTTSEDDDAEEGQLLEHMAIQDDGDSWEIQSYVYVPDAGEAAVFDYQVSQESRPLARILASKSSVRCRTKKECRNIFKNGDCCRNKCFDLSVSDANCGKCKKGCDTKKGYFCKSGKCKKLQLAGTACNNSNPCRGHYSCCNGQCLNVREDGNNCGTCGRKCPWGSACCSGKCKSLGSDESHCGQCGRKCQNGQTCCLGVCTSLKTNPFNCGMCGTSCGWGRTCCDGKCVFLITDKDNCGRCGQKCREGVKCLHGICGYGQ